MIEISETELSPYRLAQIASDLVGREVRPQLVYSYCRQNLIKAERNQLGHWSVSKSAAEVWLNKYVPKHSVK